MQNLNLKITIRALNNTFLIQYARFFLEKRFLNISSTIMMKTPRLTTF